MSKISHIYRHVQENTRLAQEGLNQGQKGEPGDHGKSGERGLKGLQGIKGDRGDIGQTTIIKFAFNNVDPLGLPKSGVIPAGFDGEGVPEASIRVDVGDCVVHVPTGDLWCYLPRNTYLGWIKIGKVADSVVGIPGDKGEQGDEGPRGFQGEPGLRGDRGLQGIEGPAGADGLKGETGETGQKGQKGVKGERGSDGAKGEGGLNGFDGLDGEKGIKGDPGLDGTEGSKGERGLQGEKGEKGAQPDIMQLGLMPFAAVNFDGRTLTVKNSYNFGSIKPLSTGRYRLRFANKLLHDNFVVMAHAAVKDGGESHARLITVTERNQSSCVVDVESLNGEKCDADSIDILVYQFSG